LISMLRGLVNQHFFVELFTILARAAIRFI